jgi:predicted AlkP superfamily phosphohydrolase/phosphomutase
VSSAKPVLAIGLDAAEASLLDHLVAEGSMPVVADVLARGKRLKVDSAATVGSGAVWPTFYTGTSPAQHGVHSGWAWDPAGMRIQAVHTGNLRPFWRDLEDDGLRVGVLDVPYAPPTPTPRGFDVMEWGAHDQWLGGPAMAPAAVAAEVRAFGPHPFSRPEITPIAPDDRVDHAVIARACVEGAQRKGDLAARLLHRERPDLGLVVFGEVHRSGHDLWHTVSNGAALHAGLPAEEYDVSPGLADVYREMDRQIGRLVQAATPDTAIVVFSLHGFRPGRGVVVLLAPVLHALGYSCDLPPAKPTARSLARGSLAAVKRRTPLAVKRIYHHRVSHATRMRLAGPTMMPALDWGRTRAFSLPSDQHGWVRVNLRGREAQGIVDPSEYDATIEEVAAALSALTDEEGWPLVTATMRPDPDGPADVLPDLVVHWSEAAFADPLRIAGVDVETRPLAPRITGQHKAEGFCVAVGVDAPSETVDTADLHRLLRPT